MATRVVCQPGKSSFFACANLVALFTLLGRALSLLAAYIILRRSITARRHERAIAPMHDEFDRGGNEAYRAFMAYEEQVMRHSGHPSDPAPVPPFGGIERNEHAEHLQSRF
jgi:hypothetical protein